MSKDTIMIFQTMTGFRQRIEQVFGDVDERRQAERSIQTFRQKGAAAQYIATFQ
jgi:hypothetical protein